MQGKDNILDGSALETGASPLPVLIGCLKDEDKELEAPRSPMESGSLEGKDMETEDLTSPVLRSCLKAEDVN